MYTYIYIYIYTYVFVYVFDYSWPPQSGPPGGRGLLRPGAAWTR